MNDLAGMTVNERLFATGLLEAWDQAIALRDAQAMRAILAKIDLADQAESIIKSVLLS